MRDIKKIDTDFTDFVTEIKERIKSSQYEALRSVNSEKLQTLSREIAWTHNVTIFQKSKDDEKLQPLVREIGKFEPEYAGKMSFYLSVLNDTIKLPKDIEGYLPSSEDIAARLMGVFDDIDGRL